MQKVVFLWSILQIFPFIQSKECLQAGQTINLTFLYHEKSLKKFIRINTMADILYQSEVDSMYISTNNQTKLFQIFFEQCRKTHNVTMICPTKSRKIWISMPNTINKDCTFNIQEINSFLRRILRLSSSNNHSYEYNKTSSASSITNIQHPHNYVDNSNKLIIRKLIILLSVFGCFICLFITGCIICHITDCIRRRQIRHRRKKVCIYSIKKPLGQFPVIIFMMKNHQEDFLNNIPPKCTICLEPFRDHTRVRQLNCSHYFHVLCLNSWVLTHEKCPLCSQYIFKQVCPSISEDISIVNDESTDFSMISNCY